jgi:hypothetical protein
MQIAAEGGLSIPITWFFCPPTAGFIGQPTAFCSSNWDKMRGMVYELGESRGTTRTYYKGGNPWGYAGLCHVGSRRAWLMGLSTDELAAPAAPLPECCRPTRVLQGYGGVQVGGVSVMAVGPPFWGGPGLDYSAGFPYAGAGGPGLDYSAGFPYAGAGGPGLDYSAGFPYAGAGGPGIGGAMPPPVTTDPACGTELPATLVGILFTSASGDHLAGPLFYGYLVDQGLYGWSGTIDSLPVEVWFLGGAPAGPLVCTISGKQSEVPHEITCPQIPGTLTVVIQTVPVTLIFYLRVVIPA